MRRWIKLLAAFLAILLLVWLGYIVVNGLTGLLVGAGMEISERDPMFAEEPEKIERPAELYAEEAPPKKSTLDDYVPEEESPVDMTVEELIREAQEAAENP